MELDILALLIGSVCSGLVAAMSYVFKHKAAEARREISTAHERRSTAPLSGEGEYGPIITTDLVEQMEEQIRAWVQ